MNRNTADRLGQLACVHALTVLALLVSAEAPAANLNFLKDSPFFHFKDADYDLMLKNALAVLDAAPAGAKQVWRNPATGASGAALVRRDFKTSDGTTCKRLWVYNQAQRVEGEATYTVCNMPERGWVLSPNARAAK